MHEPIWNQYLTQQDKQVFSASGFGALQGFGKRPAGGIVFPDRERWRGLWPKLR